MTFAARSVAFFRQNLAKLGLGAVLLFFCTAPTPGDVGGCGQETANLDAGIFFASKQSVDCAHCRACGLTQVSCDRACNDPRSYPVSFPERCAPLVHDGEVCLRALDQASCDDYATYMDDRAPQTPTECNFCPEPAP